MPHPSVTMNGSVAGRPAVSRWSWNVADVPTVRGTYTYRVVWLADADHQGTQTASKVLTVS